MEIKRAEKMGFCFGVAGAINLCNKVVSEKKFEGRLFILGMLVHNKNVTSDMEKKGLIHKLPVPRENSSDEIL